MIRPTYQSRLSALILGVRPSVAHIYGAVDPAPADNLTVVGTLAWRAGVQLLLEDLQADERISTGEVWLMEWAMGEKVREQRRWTDASSMIELLALSLGPVEAGADTTRGRVFWNQWRKNISDLVSEVENGTALVSQDTSELSLHLVKLLGTHSGPREIVDSLRWISELPPSTEAVEPVFRPLSSAVERLQLSALIAATFVDQPVCSAAQATLLGKRAAPIPTAGPASSCGRTRRIDLVRPLRTHDRDNYRHS